MTALCLAIAGPVGATDAADALAKFERKLRVLDGRAAQQYAHSDRFRPDELNSVPPYSGDYRGALVKEARGAARRYNVPENIFLRLVDQESRWNIQAVSSKGARGLAQLMPDTAKELRVDPDNPSENLEGGARYLAQQYARFKSWRLALAAYNAGPGAVEKYGDVPPFAETQDYVQKILGN
ncbi:MAG: lytic transglycosylase domain-containing protein [Boseongicola sp.]|nr:lytic transglycosylase domain-containing protein [Boseongicola sp.]